MTGEKVCLVCSSGGHLSHLMQLRSYWEKKDRVWVTFRKEDAITRLKNEKLYFCFYPSNRSLKAFCYNLLLAFHVFLTERPDVVISTGAAVAVPFLWLAKLFRIKTVYVEVFDMFDRLSLTGKLVYPISDLFFVQWPQVRRKYPKAKYIGCIF